MTDPDCARCGRPIFEALPGQWYHYPAGDGMVNVGCRAASYQPDVGWNESLDRRWRATPIK